MSDVFSTLSAKMFGKKCSAKTVCHKMKPCCAPKTFLFFTEYRLGELSILFFPGIVVESKNCLGVSGRGYKLLNSSTIC